MYTLYWEHMAGSIVVQATLEAIDADYRMHYVDMSAGQHLKTDFLKLNPAARIPAFEPSRWNNHRRNRRHRHSAW